MKKIAIDVVLLTPEEIVDKSIELNREIIKKDDRVILNKESCFPHITLLMGCLKEDDISEVNELLKDIAKDFSPLTLTITNTYGESSVGFETVVNKLSKYLSYDATPDMLYPPVKPENISVPWINNFKKNATFENFFPHITLGFGKVPDIELPITFTVSKLALCHLGNYCTCRKILGSAELGLS